MSRAFPAKRMQDSAPAPPAEFRTRMCYGSLSGYWTRRVSSSPKTPVRWREEHQRTGPEPRRGRCKGSGESGGKQQWQRTPAPLCPAFNLFPYSTQEEGKGTWDGRDGRDAGKGAVGSMIRGPGENSAALPVLGARTVGMLQACNR